MLQLRPVTLDDLPTVHLWASDEPSRWMAAFDRAQARPLDDFVQRWTEILSDPQNSMYLLSESGAPVGYFVTYPVEGQISIGYWIAREHWGRGLATAGLARLLEQISDRPLIAHAAADNLGSIRVLEKNGFHQFESTTAHSPVRDQETVELGFRLDR